MTRRFMYKMWLHTSAAAVRRWRGAVDPTADQTRGNIHNDHGTRHPGVLTAIELSPADEERTPRSVSERRKGIASE